MEKYRSLATTITFLGTLVILFAAALIAGSVYFIAESFFLKSTESHLQSRTELISNDIENAFLKLENDLVVLSKTPPIQGIVRNKLGQEQSVNEGSKRLLWEDRLSTIFTAMLKVNPDYTRIRYISADNNGKEIVSVNRARDEVFRTHEDALKRIGDKKYFQKAITLKQGRIGFSRIDISSDDAKEGAALTPTLRIFMPVYTATQTIFGVLMINIDMNKFLREILIRSSIKYNIYLYDRYKDLFIYNQQETTLAYYPSSKLVTLPRIDNKLFANNAEFINYVVKNKNNFTVISPVYADPEKQYRILTLINSIPLGLMVREDRSAINYIILDIIVIALIASLLIYFITKKKMSRLSDLALAIANTSPGKQDKIKLPTELNDEVGMLARAFEKKSKQLEELALYDALTGLPNRNNFSTYLFAAINRANRNKYSVAVVYLDIDKFKEVNDNYGHDYGDALLVKFANKLKSVARKTDFCARLSGDEFAVVAEASDGLLAVKRIAGHYEKELSSTYSIKGLLLSVTISGGISLYPEFAQEQEVLLKQADHLMYRSKQEGKGIFHYYKDPADIPGDDSLS